MSKSKTFSKHCSSAQLKRWLCLGCLLVAELIILITLEIFHIFSEKFIFKFFLIQFFLILSMGLAYIMESDARTITMLFFYRILISLTFMIVLPLIDGDELSSFNYFAIAFHNLIPLIKICQECYIYKSFYVTNFFKKIFG